MMLEKQSSKHGSQGVKGLLSIGMVVGMTSR